MTSDDKQKVIETFKEEWIKYFGKLADSKERDGYFVLGFLISVLNEIKEDKKPIEPTAVKASITQQIEMLKIFTWLSGYNIEGISDFPEKKDGEQGNYYWRSHMREYLKKTGIDWDEKKGYVLAP